MVIAMIGLGEVGSIYSCGMAQNGARVKGYDLKFHTEGMTHFLSCKKAGVELVGSPRELIEGSDIILAVTSCSQAMETAEMYKPYLTKEQRYVELNSTVPRLVHQVENFLDGCCTFVDGTTLNLPSQLGVATPVVMSGAAATATAEELNSWGMNIRVLGDQVGQASAFKVIRSIFTKGLEGVLNESLSSARYYRVEKEIFDSIVAFLDDEPVRETLSLILQTEVMHAKRRGDEIGEISKMLVADGLENTMSAAAAKKLYWSDSLGLKEVFGGKKAEDLADVLDAILKKQGK